MATQSLLWVPFLLSRNTTGDANRSNPDPLHIFYCRLSTARFLDITNFIYKGTAKGRRKAHTRFKTLADGTTLGGTDVQVAESEFPITAKRAPRGGKNIKLVTGKKTPNGNYQTVSFSFPKSVPSLIIGEALGELIPGTKIKSEPTANDIFPYAVSPAGGRIAIIQKAAADASTDAQVALNPQIALTLLQRLDRVYLQGAG